MLLQRAVIWCQHDLPGLLKTKSWGMRSSRLSQQVLMKYVVVFFFLSYPFPPQSKARIIHAPLGRLLEKIFSSARNPHQHELPELGRLLTGFCKAEDKRVAPPAALLAARGGKEASW